MAAPRFQLSDRRMFTLRESLVVTAVSALVPGVAQLRAGRRRAAAVLVAVYAVLVVTAALTPLALSRTPPRAGRDALTTFGPAVIAVAWVTLVLLSYRAARPAPLTPPARAVAGTAVTLLCALVAALPLMFARHGDHVAASRALPRTVPARPGAPAASVPPVPRPTPEWSGSRRLNLLLVARDAGRTAGVTLASVDPRNGATVLLRLPAGLRRLPLPDLPRSTSLRSVYGYGLAHPWLAGEHAANPGAELLKRTVGRIVGMPVDYYRVVGVWDLRRIVAAAHSERGCGPRPALLPARHEAVRGGHHGAATTDVPRRLPSSLAGLRGKTGKARISAVRLAARSASGRIEPGRPDYRYLRGAAARAVRAPRPSAASGPPARAVCR